MPCFPSKAASTTLAKATLPSTRPPWPPAFGLPGPTMTAWSPQPSVRGRPATNTPVSSERVLASHDIYLHVLKQNKSRVLEPNPCPVDQHRCCTCSLSGLRSTLAISTWRVSAPCKAALKPDLMMDIFYRAYWSNDPGCPTYTNPGRFWTKRVSKSGPRKLHKTLAQNAETHSPTPNPKRRNSAPFWELKTEWGEQGILTL